MLRALRIGGWTFLPDLHLLQRDGVERRLEPKQAEVLAVLAADPGAVLSKRRLLDAVWRDLHVTEEVLTNAVYELRRALGDSARQPRYIQTIPRRGYRLVAAVASQAAPTTSTVRPRRGLAAAAAAAVATLGIVAAVATGDDDARDRASRLLEAGTAALAVDTAAGDAAALGALEEAVVADPRSAGAWAALAAVRCSLVSRGELSAAAGLPLAEQAARRALALEPRRPAAWTTLGQVHAARWEWGDAERALRRAIDLAPRSGVAQGAYAEYLLLTGRRDEARRAIGKALALDPASARVLLGAGFVYSMLRDVEAATDAYRRVLADRPDHPDARRQLDKLSRSLWPPANTRITAVEVDQVLRKQPLRPAIVAGLFAAAGEDERAMAWLRRARDEKDPSLLLVRLDDRWVRLHDDARYRAILDDIGL
jgi:DNA-binding winged helix-turn-helix (wHTH) protein